MGFHGQAIRNVPHYRPRFQDASGYHRFRGKLDGFEAFVLEQVLQRLVHAAAAAAPNETIGYLVGRAYRDAAGDYAIVNAALVAADAKRSRTYVEATIEDEIALIDVLESDHPTSEKMGWWHSHPFDMHNYSSTDEANQEIHCPREYQVGLLVCIVGEDATIYAFQGPGSHCMDNDYRFQIPEPSARPTAASLDLPPRFRGAAESDPRLDRSLNDVHVNMTIGGLGKVAWAILLVLGLIWPVLFLLLLLNRF